MTRAGRLQRTGAVACLLAASSCQDAWAELDLERMIDQPRGDAYEASAYFANGQLMQTPPEGTLPAGRSAADSGWFEAGTRDRYRTHIPAPVDRALLQRGRARFEVVCATCHGLDGSGHSVVAESMVLRRPPSLVAEPVRSYPVGRVFRAITQGYGLMPAFTGMLDARDRWAVSAYLRALSRSQSAPLSALPDALQRRALEALR